MDIKKLQNLPDSTTLCLRCKTPMKDTGQVTLHRGKTTVLGVGAAKFELLELTAEVCPKCGKLEFFV